MLTTSPVALLSALRSTDPHEGRDPKNQLRRVARAVASGCFPSCANVSDLVLRYRPTNVGLGRLQDWHFLGMIAGTCLPIITLPRVMGQSDIEYWSAIPPKERAAWPFAWKGHGCVGAICIVRYGAESRGPNASGSRWASMRRKGWSIKAPEKADNLGRPRLDNLWVALGTSPSDFFAKRQTRKNAVSHEDRTLSGQVRAVLRKKEPRA